MARGLSSPPSRPSPHKRDSDVDPGPHGSVRRAAGSGTRVAKAARCLAQAAPRDSSHGRGQARDGPAPRVPLLSRTRAFPSRAGPGQCTPLLLFSPLDRPGSWGGHLTVPLKCALTTRLSCLGHRRGEKPHTHTHTHTLYEHARKHTCTHRHALTLLHVNGRMHAHAHTRTVPQKQRWITVGGHPFPNLRRWPAQPTASARVGERQVSDSTPVPAPKGITALLSSTRGPLPALEWHEARPTSTLGEHFCFRPCFAPDSARAAHHLTLPRAGSRYSFGPSRGKQHTTPLANHPRSPSSTSRGSFRSLPTPQFCEPWLNDTLLGHKPC